MSLRRPAAAGFGVAAIACGLLYASAGWRSAATPVSLRSGQAYAVPTEPPGERTTFDLSLDASRRYVLIVSSLGAASRSHSVTLQSEPVAAVERQPMLPLPPPRPRPPIAPTFQDRPPSSSQSAASERNPQPVADHRTNAAAPADGARIFHLHVTDGSLDDPRQYTAVRSLPVAEGQSVRVYLDEQFPQSRLAAGLLDDLVTHFDQVLIPRFQPTFGTFRDVDGDGRFAVLLTPWLGRLQGGRTALGGFVRPSDFRTDLPAPLSNACDMLYLNTDLEPGPRLHTLLVHEFTHAVCFSVAASEAAPRLPPSQEDWLNEALAHLAENLYGDGWSNLDYRISRFLTAPHRAPLVVPDYYRAGLWRDHGCRGATYLFLRWCVDQYGESLLTNLVRSPVTGIRSLERATGERFDDLVRHWSLALLQSSERRQPPSAAADGSPAWRPYAALDLREPLAGWGLAGPRLEPCDLDEDVHRWQLPGTALLFLELHASGPAGPRRLRIQADRGTRLQITLVPRSPDWPRSRLSIEMPAASPHRPTPPPVGSADGPSFEVVVRHNRAGIRVESLAWEQNQEETKHTACVEARTLDAIRLPAEADGEERFRLSIPAAWSDHLPIVVKAVACDRQGRRASAWATIRPRSPRRERLAAFDRPAQE